jgi:hypothetical protein
MLAGAEAFAYAAPSMRLLPLLLLLLAAAASAENTAQIRLYCASVRVLPGTGGAGTAEFRVYSGNDPGAPNGELYPLLDDELPTHAAGFVLEDVMLETGLLGDLLLDVPESADANGNGVPDFYEVDLGLARTATAGFFFSAVDDGEAAAQWQRTAGRRDGTVQLQLTADSVGPLTPTAHVFEIIELRGTLRYTPGPGPITGRVDLAEAGGGPRRLAGPLVILPATDGTPAFDLGESVLTNHHGAPVPLTIGILEQDPASTFSYFGVLSLLNGDPETPEVDYELFYVGVDDPNDADGDGHPDLTDGGGAVPPGPPLLTITAVGTNRLTLSVTGGVGRSYAVQASDAPAPPAGWSTLLSVTLTNTTQAVATLTPDGAARFFRAVTP